MKRVGIIVLIFLIFFNTTFALCYHSFALVRNNCTEECLFAKDKTELSFDISADSLIQPFLMDSEFSNITAHVSCFDNILNIIKGVKSLQFTDISSTLFTDINDIRSSSILVSNKYFISCERLMNLLDNLFMIRI